MQVGKALKPDPLQQGCVQKKSYSPSTESKRGQYNLMNKERVVYCILPHNMQIRTEWNYQNNVSK